ncbi:YihY/virulence factor BrkB family protein [Rhodocytophaga rosea]|uniref:YihY/virulence factor BrkB family protein n=1 Tax=Rhodocytophaga rosea TaxID=2704465 RepID=A0A6C0GH25_9BACT|nr:YihY/virulence factor BrkB family protein [Rhodocytophaga rosea]QHT67185.1 YihY/virulence factor BrkB family protein [Rhodocytophaga rosea]
MKKKVSNVFSFIKEMYAEWTADNCFQLAAALSYYTLFSIAPMLIIVISVAGYFFGEEAINGEIQRQMSSLVGNDGAEALAKMIQSAYIDAERGLLPTIVGIVTLFLSATLAFTALQDSLNKIWKVQLKPQSGIMAVVINRVLSFAMVLGIGFLLLVSMVINSLLSALNKYIERLLADYSVYLIKLSALFIGFAVITVLFAMIFKFLPDVKIKWRNVWIGALLTSFLFSVGRYLISWQIGNSDLTNTYGAAASIVGIILWINYSSLILFIGAEFIYVYVKRKGETIKPDEHAIKINYGRDEHAVQSAEADAAHPAYAGRNSRHAGKAIVIDKSR